MKFEVTYRDGRTDVAELSFDILCRISEKYDITIVELNGAVRADWLAWGVHQALTDEGKTSLDLSAWRKTIKDFVPVEDDNLNPTDPAV